MLSSRSLSTADARRDVVVSSAIVIFARKGLRATPIADVAEHAAISPAYVSKLFTTKTQLFVAALDECYARILTCLTGGADSVGHDATPHEVLDAMGGAYASLIADRDLLMLQVHAQAATDDPEIATAVRRGVAKITEFVSARSRAQDHEVQQFFAFGQLCHLLTTIDAFDLSTGWATTLTTGIRHSEPLPPPERRT